MFRELMGLVAGLAGLAAMVVGVLIEPVAALWIFGGSAFGVAGLVAVSRRADQDLSGEGVDEPSQDG